MRSGDVRRLVQAARAAARGFSRSLRESAHRSDGLVNLNVGSGRRSIPGFIDLDLPSAWYHRDRGRRFTAYDMSRDLLPFADGMVDNIYCSHVIEHVTDETAGRFLSEASRVLRPGGVLRIATPDASFLWHVSRFPNGYWSWRRDTLVAMGVDPAACDQHDYLIRELATRRLRHLPGGDDTCHKMVGTAPDADTAIALLADERGPDLEKLGYHINQWTVEKLARLAAGRFAHIVTSKFRGCVSPTMSGPAFDRTRPGMSLYVDLVR